MLSHISLTSVFIQNRELLTTNSFVNKYVEYCVYIWFNYTLHSRLLAHQLTSELPLHLKWHNLDTATEIYVT